MLLTAVRGLTFSHKYQVNTLHPSLDRTNWLKQFAFCFPVLLVRFVLLIRLKTQKKKYLIHICRNSLYFLFLKYLNVVQICKKVFNSFFFSPDHQSANMTFSLRRNATKQFSKRHQTVFETPPNSFLNATKQFSKRHQTVFETPPNSFRNATKQFSKRHQIVF